MESSNFKKIYDSVDYGKTARIQLNEVTENIKTSSRREMSKIDLSVHKVLLEFIDGFYSICVYFNSPEEAVSFYNSYGKTTVGIISDDEIKKEEIKICPDAENTNVGIIIGETSFRGVRVDAPIPFIRFVFCENKHKNFIINNGIRLEFNYGNKGFSDNSFLNEEERAVVDGIMQKQREGNWYLEQNIHKEEKPSADIYNEITKLFESTGNGSNIIDIKELKISRGYEDSSKALNSLIGMDNIKEEIKILESRLKYIRAMEKKGFFSEEPMNLHMCFMGAPGTGKTTVARILTGLFSDYGYIKKNKCIEINGRQLIGAYVGQTGTRTAKIIKAAKGGVLFIDEAYSLLPPKDGRDSYANEAVAMLLKEMEDSRGDLIVIFAGYYNDMQQFLSMNEGFRSRINKNIMFDNYTPEQTIEMFVNMLRREKYYIDRDALEKLYLIIKKCCMGQRFSNGRFTRNLYEKVCEEHAYRVKLFGADRDVITIADFDDEHVCYPIIDATR